MGKLYPIATLTMEELKKAVDPKLITQLTETDVAYIATCLGERYKETRFYEDLKEIADKMLENIIE